MKRTTKAKVSTPKQPKRRAIEQLKELREEELKRANGGNDCYAIRCFCY